MKDSSSAGRYTQSVSSSVLWVDSYIRGTTQHWEIGIHLGKTNHIEKNSSKASNCCKNTIETISILPALESRIENMVSVSPKFYANERIHTIREMLAYTDHSKHKFWSHCSTWQKYIAQTMELLTYAEIYTVKPLIFYIHFR